MKRITFATNTAPNTLEYTKLLVKSLKENLDGKEHELLFFVDSDNDGTIEYLRSIKNDFYQVKIVTHTLRPVVGPERNINLIVELASNDIVSYLQTDMVVSKNYDTNILSTLENDCILSSTRIEPPLHGISDKTVTKNFGLDPQNFEWDNFLEFSNNIKHNKEIEYFFAPFTFYKSAWEKIGGFDTIFRRSRCDSDLVQRCLRAGIKLKQTFKANVYHFTCVSSRGKKWYETNNQDAQKRVELQNKADNIELRKFIRRWGGFNHGESKLKKYDLDLTFSGNSSDKDYLIYSLEPFFSRVWFTDQEQRNRVLELNKNEHDYANALYNFTNEDWEKSKIFYNQTNYESIYKFGEPTEFNIKVKIDFNKISNNDDFLQNIQNITQIIGESDAGIYELGCAVIEIKKLVEISEINPLINNPKFDYNLLIIE